MNRRGFIATITAIAGVALARIKAPAAPKYIAGCDPAAGLDKTLFHVQRIDPIEFTHQRMAVLTEGKVWLSTPDGFKEFKVTYKH